jgi:S-phase kinase-associated protein 1
MILIAMPTTVQLVSNEGESFDVAIENAKMSTLIFNLIENQEDQDEDETQEIPLPNVKSTILSSVIEFMNHCATEPMNEIEKVRSPSSTHSRSLQLYLDFLHLTHLFITSSSPLYLPQPLKSANMAEVVQDWYARFVAVEQETLFELILAANYMDIKPLLDLTCATVASMIKGKTPEEIRKTFNIVNDFTPEEEAQVREENKWCEEA